LDLLELMPPLAALCLPPTVIDKTRYSCFTEPTLLAHLREREADALIISGSESDRAERGWPWLPRHHRARRRVCSSDEGHDMLLRLYHTRFSER
jgi:hypothetical protein